MGPGAAEQPWCLGQAVNVEASACAARRPRVGGRARGAPTPQEGRREGEESRERGAPGAGDKKGKVVKKVKKTKRTMISLECKQGQAEFLKDPLRKMVISVISVL